METALSYSKPAAQKNISQYQMNSILNASPVELVLKLYDLAIVSIKKGELKKATLVLTELIAALNFEYQEVSVGLFRLYRYCQECLYQKKTQEALSILTDLRQTWAKAFDLI